MKIQFKTQRLSYGFFISMLLFFAIQMLFGLLLAIIHLDPTILQGTLNFNVARAFHLNFAVVWVVTGFIGTILLIGPILGQRDVRPVWLVKFLLIALWVIAIWSFITLPLAHKGIAGWVGNVPLLQQGKEFLEGGRITGFLLLIGFSIFAFLTLHMFPKKKKEWNEMHWGLAVGVVGLATVWVFALFSSENLDLQEYFRWYVVHYWVEAVWEILHITIIGFLLYKFFGADEGEVGFAVFWGVSLVILSGLIGNSHHYFWIGTPAFWQFWGSLFSALEPLPLIFCIWHVYLDEKHGLKPIKNRAAFYFIFGSALFEMVGAGILGFTMTLAYVNIWEHGTWITASHGHMALFGAFGLLVIGAAYEGIRQVKGIERFNDKLSKLAFWMLFTGIVGIVASFAYGGTNQIYVYRILGLDWWGHHIRPAMSEARVFLALFAFLFTFGTVILIYDLLTLQNRKLSEREISAINNRLTHPKTIGKWSRGMSRFEFGKWLLALWFMGLTITGGLFAFGMKSVRLGDPVIPNILAFIGYGGLFLITTLFAIRFLKAFEARQDMLQLIDLYGDDQIQKIDLSSLGEKPDEELDKLVLNTFNSIEYGQAFILSSDKDLKSQHLMLYDALGPGFIWETVEDGPEHWKAKIGKVN
ncbi:MAG: cbb3-type cytochrome c oxidase subunit I [Flavobacteriia bacterium]|nr:cbb3-type cytochrome c oxidase subunit I [Flavobacteriia bacterium]